MTDDDRLDELLTHLGTGGPGDTIQDALRHALGDPSLEIVYVRVGQGGWIDKLGQQTTGPDPTVDRVLTPIDRDGKPVAGLLHDVALLDRPDRLRAAIDAVSLAIDNERLKADLRAELLDVQASRARIVEAGDRELKRVERNLHDGAQQRLVGLALVLRLASRSAAGDPTVTALLADAAHELDDAIAELRALTRGIHPSIVDDAGLAGALETLAERPGVPVVLEIDLPAHLPVAVQVAAYYVVTEALTNTNKHAAARQATVRATVADGTLHVAVIDDGVGGARATAGSGLEGLDDRVRALDGRLCIDSRPGLGTTVVVEIPLASAVRSDGEHRRIAALKWFITELWDMPPESADQITDEDNLIDAKGILLCAGGNARITDREREWFMGYRAAANDAEWVVDAVRTYDDSETLEDLMLVPGFPNVIRGQLYMAIRLCLSDGPLTEAERHHLERAADATGLQREVLGELLEIALAELDLRRRRHEAIAAPVLPRWSNGPS